MPEKHPKRPRDLNQWAKHMVDLATGNTTANQVDTTKDAAAVSLGRRGGLKGGKARAASDDVRRWQEDIQRWEATKAEADQRINELRRKLDAAALIAGTSTVIADAQVLRAPKTPDDGEQESMGAAAKRLMGAAGVPLFHSQLQAELRKTERFREMLDRNNGAYYYTMINRLKKRGEVKKVGTSRIRLVHKDETPPEGNPEGAS